MELGGLALLAQPAQGAFAHVLELGPRRMALWVGGICGEDPESPLVSAMAQGFLREEAGPEVCPSHLLRAVNQRLHAELEGRSFIAMTYLLVDLETGWVRFARAGLPAPLLINPDQPESLRSLDSEGMVLGLDPGPIFDSTLEVQTFELYPGDMIVLLTNGILEAKDHRGRELGLETMQQLIRRYGRHEAAYLIDKSKEYLELQFGAGRPPSADVCLLALRNITEK